MIGLGFLNSARGKPENIGDQIPVDFVTNGIIAALWFYAGKKGVHVLHSGTSERNPVTWALATSVVRRFWRENPSSKMISRPNFELYSSRWKLKVLIKTY